MSDYQPRTPERLVEILRAKGENPRSFEAEAADRIEMFLWNPIESAPLSQAVLIWDGKCSGEARYYDSAKGWWWVSGDPTDYYDRQCYPTHWMSLPDGPV